MLIELRDLSGCRRSGPPMRFKRTPRRRASAFARYGSGARQDRPDPAKLVADMQAAGAVFYIRADADRRDFRYAFHLRDGADAERCRALAAQAKADPDLLVLVKVATFVAIMRGAWNLPEKGRS